MTTPLVPADHWKAEYFGVQDLSGAPVAVVDEGTGFVDHSWGDGGPAGLTDHFSARFTRTVTLAAGRYRFTVTTDDGSRLWVDNQLTIDAWWPQPSTGHTAEVDLAGGGHTLRYEYFEQTGGATARLTWVLLTPVVLASGEALWENQTRVSLDGANRLQYQGDGNLVVVRLADEWCAWSSQTNGTTVGMTVMQGDSNLVVYNADWIPVWNSGTAGYDGARLEIANHTMAIVGPDGTTRWAVSLAAEPAARAAAAGATTGLGAGAWRPGGSGGAGAVLVFLLAVIGAAARRARAHLPATALLLTATLLVPATALAQIPTQQVEYYHTDVLGSVRAVTEQVNGQWQVVARRDYIPFGEEVAPPSLPQEKRLFTGKERDHETGLDYFGARYLRASTRTFAMVDPASGRVQDPQSWNRYAYAPANPLKYVDPDGREFVLAAGLSRKDQEYLRSALAEAIRHGPLKEMVEQLASDPRRIVLTVEARTTDEQKSRARANPSDVHTMAFGFASDPRSGRYILALDKETIREFGRAAGRTTDGSTTGRCVERGMSYSRSAFSSSRTWSERSPGRASRRSAMRP